MTQSQLNKLSLSELSNLNRMVVDTIKSKKKTDSKEKRKEVQQTKRRTNWSLFFWGFLVGFVTFFILRIIDKFRRII